jgi:hypothetical protein
VAARRRKPVPRAVPLVSMTRKRQDLDPIANALAATREARNIDFKSGFNSAATRDWCELLKDILAFANSGGGAIVVGVDARGAPIEGAALALLAVDPADVGNKIRKYTGSDFDDFSIVPSEKCGVRVAVFQVGSVDAPLIPIRPGTYEIESQKQTTAFSVGVVYVRHGAKSEPGTTDDVAKFIERRVRAQRSSWMAGVRKVIAAPPGAVVTVAHAIVPNQRASSTPVRMTLDPSAPAASIPDFDKTHPHRMKELLDTLSRRLSDRGIKVTAPSIRMILNVFGLTQDVAFTWKPKHGPRQYTEAFVEWVEAQLRKDARFITKTRARFRRETPGPSR